MDVDDDRQANAPTPTYRGDSPESDEDMLPSEVVSESNSDDEIPLEEVLNGDIMDFTE